MSTDYTVAVELAGDPDPEALALGLPAGYSLVQSPFGKLEVVVTVHGSRTVLEAIVNGMSALIGMGGLSIYSVVAMPADEWQRRLQASPVPVVLSVPQAADALGVTQGRVRQLLDASKLAGMKVGRDWLVYRVAVDARKAALAEEGR